MNQLESYLETNFKGVNLIDSFEDYQLKLHLMLEKEQYQLDENEDINLSYFNSVYSNAKQIMNDLISDQDDLTFIIQISKEPFQNYKKLNIISKFITNARLTYKLKFKEELNEIQRFSLDCKKEDIKIDYIVRSICNQDFPELAPRLKEYQGSVPEIFILNKTTGIIIHLYDDRGCFILFKNEEQLNQYHKKYEDLILEE
ncbi:hypothetical protein CHI12_16760 [Terribacillus saccharophilus]|uniref:DUF3885 domain-containing protein n=1 Tax=Terribacillus saccharophilus TaxID=361277 RepID=A0A268H934_9BACI|nr:DUF3885 domain-containing protein [Terribacillus saccharophilus]PAE06371.1 hypothetical protein CHI12_16760 [Terribacillus saccharophilus]